MHAKGGRLYAASELFFRYENEERKNLEKKREEELSLKNVTVQYTRVIAWGHECIRKNHGRGHQNIWWIATSSLHWIGYCMQFKLLFSSATIYEQVVFFKRFFFHSLSPKPSIFWAVRSFFNNRLSWLCKKFKEWNAAWDYLDLCSFYQKVFY